MGWQQRHSRGLTVNWELAQYLQDAHADWAIFQEQFAPGKLAEFRLRIDIREITTSGPLSTSEAPAKLSCIGPSKRGYPEPTGFGGSVGAPCSLSLRHACETASATVRWEGGGVGWVEAAFLLASR